MTHILGRRGARRRHGERGAALAFAGLVAGALAGCGTPSSTPTPNRPPETEITAPRDSSRVSHHVTFYYFGGDRDGTPAYYEYILDTYAPEVATIDQVVLREPAVGDPRWTRVDTNRLQLVLKADVLRVDRRGDIGAGLFDRWQTLYLRAVDNEGAVDESPAKRTVQAYTAAPRLWLDSPAVVGARITMPATFVMNWNGVDAIGGASEPAPIFQDPLESRWVLRRVPVDGSGQPLGYPDSLYDLPDSAWSQWQPWSRLDATSRRAILRPVVGGAPATFVFAVQGRDDGGAVTPKFDAGTVHSNNCSFVLVDTSLPTGPRLRVRDSRARLGPWTFAGSAADSFQVSAAGVDTLLLEWDDPVASHYGAGATDTRYGWDITDPSNEGQWTAWSTGRKAAPHVLVPPSQQFLVQCRDDIGQITTGRIRFLKP